MPEGASLAAREIFRAGYLEFAWVQLCRAQEFLEAQGGQAGITPPHFFAYWRLQFETAFTADIPWEPMPPKKQGA